MASTPSGTVVMNVNLAIAIPVGGNILTAYTVPVQPQQSQSYAIGTAAGQVNKVAEVGGSAAAAAVNIDVTTVTCADGVTGISNHLREMIFYNDDPTNVLTLDFTVANAFTSMFSAGGTTAKISIQPGTHQRFSVPNGTNGYVVSGTNKIFSLNPGANTIAYRAVFAGD